jgi:hypothetical protein
MAKFPYAHTLHRCSVLALAVAATLAVHHRAEAASLFGTPGSFVIGIEDVTGYYSQSLNTWDRTHQTLELSRGNLEFGLAGGARLGVHYFIVPNLSLGGVFGYQSVSGSNTHQDRPGTWSTDIPTSTRLVIMPKVGYSLMFTEKVGLWFRAGLGYERFKQRYWEGDGENYTRQSLLVASADVLFLFTPVPFFGFFVGPTGDRSLIGSHFDHNVGEGDYSADATYWRLGLTTGLFGYF